MCPKQREIFRGAAAGAFAPAGNSRWGRRSTPIASSGSPAEWCRPPSPTNRLKSLASVELLILDDWGLQPLDAQARHDLLEILEDRYGRKSTIVTSQLPTASWHHAIGDSTYADAILDRLLHNAHRVELEGDSLRRTKASISD